MGVLHRQRWCGLTGLAVPLLTLASPAFLKISDVGPSWAVLWLLPWALVDGPASGAIAGLCLGLVLDGLHLGQASELPLGASLLLQLHWRGQLPLLSAGLHTLVAQSLITGLLAPVLCSLQLLRWRRIADLRG